MRADTARLAGFLRVQLVRLGVDPAGGPPLEPIVECQRERARTLREMAQNSVFFFRAPETYDEKAAAKHLAGDSRAVLAAAREALAALPEWSAPAVHAALEALAAARGAALGKIAQPLRVAVAGSGISPPIDQTLAILGREEVAARIARAEAWAAARAS
jgi:glutamyl-tRNA synthetase